MSINKERIRMRLANLNNRGLNNSFWTPPKEGKAVVRAFPVPNNEDPFLEYWFHFNVGKQSIFCPKKNGVTEKCPLCDLAAELYVSDSQQDKEISKKLYARQRFYATILDRADDTLTAKYWGFSQTLYIKFLTWLGEDNGDYENFLDVNEGLDLVVGVQQVPGKQFPSVEVDIKRRESALAETKKAIEEILGTVKPAEEVFVCPSLEEVQKKLDDWLNETDSEESETKQTAEKTEVTKGSTKTKEKVSTPKDIEEIFNQNFPD